MSASEQIDASALRLEGSVDALHAAIRGHYDDLIDLYEEIWGEHIHHGFWEPGAPATNRHAAQQRTVEELVQFAGIEPGARVLDVGCGVGASSIHLARTLGCACEGITLSAVQVGRAEEKAREAGVDGLVRFRVLDAMCSDYPDESFDVVWALESCELMPDKARFLSECFRVLKPGGRLAVATWCCRDEMLTADEARLLKRIYRDFAAAYVLPLSRYQQLCLQAGFAEVQTGDWTENTRGTWNLSTDLVAPFVRRPSFIWKLVRAKGTDSFRFLNSVPLMKLAYERGIMRYGVFTGVRGRQISSSGRQQ